MNILFLLLAAVLLFPIMLLSMYAAVIYELSIGSLTVWAIITIAELLLIITCVKFYLFMEKEEIMHLNPIHIQNVDIVIVDDNIYNVKKVLGRQLTKGESVTYYRYVYSDYYTSPLLEICDEKE